MRVIEGRTYLTWEDVFQRRREVRTDLYLGAELKEEVTARADAVGMALSPFLREIVRNYVRTHNIGHDPQEG